MERGYRLDDSANKSGHSRGIELGEELLPLSSGSSMAHGSAPET